MREEAGADRVCLGNRESSDLAPVGTAFGERSGYVHVNVRDRLAGGDPVVLPDGDTFRPDPLVSAAPRASPKCCYTGDPAGPGPGAGPLVVSATATGWLRWCA
jgi:hypothetical protein